MPTFTQIGTAQVVGSGGTTSITFSTIPSTYTDLMIYISIRSNRTGVNFDSIAYRFNGSTSGYQTRYLYADGSTVNSYSDTTLSPAGQVWGRFDGGAINAGNTTANTFTSIALYIPNYAGSSNKSFSYELVSENNATAAIAQVTAGLWSNTAAINEIAFRDNNLGNIAQYSTFYLYGVSNA